MRWLSMRREKHRLLLRTTQRAHLANQSLNLRLLLSQLPTHLVDNLNQLTDRTPPTEGLGIRRWRRWERRRQTVVHGRRLMRAVGAAAIRARRAVERRLSGEHALRDACSVLNDMILGRTTSVRVLLSRPHIELN